MNSSAAPADLRPWFLTRADLPDPPWDWQKLFGNEHPVELEVGCGRGLFLVTAGTTNPETNFLGVECDFKEGRRAARRLQKRALPNVRIVGADIGVILPQCVPDCSLAAIHVYFPDPWWKRRHKKRRVFSAGFVAQAALKLVPGGLLHAWTDVEEYFGVMVDLVAQNPAFLPLPPPTERQATHDMDYRTSFERKKRKLGLPIFRARWERSG